MNKRGQGEAMSIFTAFEIIVIVMVFGALIFVSTNFDYVSRASEIYGEKDLTLLANAVSSTPGKITYHYPIKEIYTAEDGEYKIDVQRIKSNIDKYYKFYNLTLTKEQGSEFKIE